MSGWDEQLSETLIHYVLKTEERDWKLIASYFPNKTSEECERWWEFLVGVDSILQEHELMSKSPEMPRKRSPVDHHSDDNSKKRQRRPAILIDRKYKCPAPDCPRAYGTEGALKFHLKSKHKDNSYSPPRSKSGSSNHNSNHSNSLPSPASAAVVPPVHSPILMPPRFFTNGMGLSPPVLDFSGPQSVLHVPDYHAQNHYQNMLKVMINPIPLYDLPLDARLLMGTFPDPYNPTSNQKL